jgi:hypothetical protein
MLIVRLAGDVATDVHLIGGQPAELPVFGAECQRGEDAKRVPPVATKPWPERL